MNTLKKLGGQIIDGTPDFLASLGFGQTQADKNARADLEDAKNAYRNLSTPDLKHTKGALSKQQLAEATLQGRSDFNNISVNPEYSRAQSAQMAALKNLAANGGRSAVSDANLARIQQGTNANAKGQRDAIMQSMNTRGMGGSGANLLAQLSSSQNATNNQSAQDMEVAGQQANTGLQAGQAAAGIGANMQNQAYNEQAQRAAANDAVSRFNAGNKTAISQFNAGQGTQNNQYNAGVRNQTRQFNTGLQNQDFQNRLAQTDGIAAGSRGSAAYYGNQDATKSRAAGGLAGGIISLFAADGGEVPGEPEVEGDSYLNDTVPAMVSPEEVVVPRTLAQSGDREEIADFVQDPPSIDEAAAEGEDKSSAVKSYLAQKYSMASDDSAIRAAIDESKSTDKRANFVRGLETIARANSVAHGGPGVSEEYYKGIKEQGRQGIGREAALRQNKIKDFIAKSQLERQVNSDANKADDLALRKDEKARGAKALAKAKADDYKWREDQDDKNKKFQAEQNRRASEAAGQRAETMAGVRSDMRSDALAEKEKHYQAGIRLDGAETKEGFRPTMDDAKKAKSAKASFDKINASLDEMDAIYKRSGTNMVGDDATRMTSLKTNILMSQKELDALGVLSGQDERLTLEQIPDPTSLGENLKSFIGQDRYQVKSDQYRKNLRSQYDSTLGATGYANTQPTPKSILDDVGGEGTALAAPAVKAAEKMSAAERQAELARLRAGK